MILGIFFLRSVARTALLVCSVLGLLGLCGSMAQTQSPTQSQPGSTSSPANPSDAAASKAAERKKRFDEQRKLLEGGVVPPKDDHRKSLDPDLMLSPMTANMLAYDQVGFRLFDKGHADITGQGSWSAGPTRVVNFYIVKGVPTVVGAGPGTAILGVRVGASRYAEATINVYPGDKLPKGVPHTIEARQQSSGL